MDKKNKQTITSKIIDSCNKLSEKEAFYFLGEYGNISVSFQKLHEKASHVACYLLNNFKPRSRILLLESGFDFVIGALGCLYAEMIPVLSKNPVNEEQVFGVFKIIQDSEAVLILGSSNYLSKCKELCQLISIGAILKQNKHFSLISKIEAKSNDIALLQYSSGSTGTPKGIVISHENLLANIDSFIKRYGKKHIKKAFFWTPLENDMAFVGGILLPLFLGIPSVLMPTTMFLKQPLNWLKGISDFSATFTVAPNFAYDLCVDSANNELNLELDLSQLKIATNAGEKVRYDTIHRFSECFKEYGFNEKSFNPGYGLAETTMGFSGKAATDGVKILTVDEKKLDDNQIKVLKTNARKGVKLVSCGSVISDHEIIIVDSEKRFKQKPFCIGEIWVRGFSVSSGYWHNEALSNNFHSKIKGKPFEYFSTGDLGFLDDEENIYITGREKEVIILRGKNYYPQDLEFVIEKAHPSLIMNGSIVFGVDKNNEEQLIVVCEVGANKQHQSIYSSILTQLSKFYNCVPYKIILVEKGTLDKTSFEKKARSIIRKKFLNDQLSIISSWSREAENKLLENDKVKLLKWLQSKVGCGRNICESKDSAMLSEALIDQFAKKGVLGALVPKKYKGLEFNLVEFWKLIDFMVAYDAGLASLVLSNACIGLYPILYYGTNKQKGEILPALATGDEFLSFALSEPGAGTDINALAVEAIPCGDDSWKIYGIKSWITSAKKGLIVVFAKVKDGSKKDLGLTAFLVPYNLPGVEIIDDPETSAWKSVSQVSIKFSGVLVSKRNLLGGIGKGLEIADKTLGFSRLSAAMMSISSIKLLTLVLSQYAAKRKISSGLLLNHPIILSRLNQYNVVVRALEKFLQIILLSREAGNEVPSQISMLIKALSSNYLALLSDDLVKSIGARSYVLSTKIPQIINDAKVLLTVEGVNDALFTYVGMSVLRRKSFRDYLSSDLGLQKLLFDIDNMYQEILQSNEPYRKCKGVRSQLDRLLYALIGEVASIGILKAVLEKKLVKKEAIDTKTLDWLDKEYQRKKIETKDQISTFVFSMCKSEILDEIAVSTNSLKEFYCCNDQLSDQFVVFNPTDVERKKSRQVDNINEYKPETKRTITENELSKWIVSWLEDRLGVSGKIIKKNTFVELGLDSLSGAAFVASLEEYMGWPLDSFIIWDYPNLKSLIKFLINKNKIKKNRIDENDRFEADGFINELKEMEEESLTELLSIISGNFEEQQDE